MPIYIGDKEIATVFKGDTELDNIQLGDQQQWIGIIVTPDPTITYISRNTSSLTFDLTNNHEETVTIFYEIDDNTPDQNSVVVAANATQRVTLSGLSFNTTYSLFAYALEAEQLPSNTISNTQTTQDITENPSILSVNPDVNSVTFSLRNNDNVTATIYYEVNDSTPDLTVSVGPGSTVSRTISGLNPSTGYTIYARALASGKVTSSTVSTGFTTDANTGPGPSSLIAGNSTTGFFGEVSQSTFGKTMTSVMSDLGITNGAAQNTSEPLLKFIHDGKVKFINKKTIRYNISWSQIASNMNIYGGETMTFGGNSYKVRLMRGYGQVSGDEVNGPLSPISYPSGVNWPSNGSPWNQSSPNEWNTLMFPIHVDGSSQTQTSNVPNWANYSNSDLHIDQTLGQGTWVQETSPTSWKRLHRGRDNISTLDDSGSTFTAPGLRLVFELI